VHWRTMYRLLEMNTLRCVSGATSCAIPLSQTAIAGSKAPVVLFLSSMSSSTSSVASSWLDGRRGRNRPCRLNTSSPRLYASCYSAQSTHHSRRPRSPMTAKTTAQLFIDLGVTESHSRPHVSDDIPIRKRPSRQSNTPFLPGLLLSPRPRRCLAGAFFGWYNHQHCHTSLALLTPAIVHFGQTLSVLAVRKTALDIAYTCHPERLSVMRPLPFSHQLGRHQLPQPVISASFGGESKP